MTSDAPLSTSSAINTIRALAIDTVQKANSGHPGLPLGAAPIGYSLFARTMRHSPKNPAWPDRDRFVLSAGHGSALLYSLLHLTGYDLPLDELQRFRQLGSQTPGHPEHGDTAGVETTTGPLGQGFANAVGMAIAERHLAARFNRPGHEIVDHRTYVIAGDGDLMEGVAQRGRLARGPPGARQARLLLRRQPHLPRRPPPTSRSPRTWRSASRATVARRRRVADGNDLAAIDARDRRGARGERPAVARDRDDRDRLRRARSRARSACTARRSAPSEVKATKRALGWPSEEPFFLADDAVKHLRAGGRARARGRGGLEGPLRRLRARLTPSSPPSSSAGSRGELPEGWDAGHPDASRPATSRSRRARPAARSSTRSRRGCRS